MKNNPRHMLEKIRVAMLSSLCLEKNRKEKCSNDDPIRKKVMEKIKLLKNIVAQEINIAMTKK
jgi:hypothetical protein